MTTPDLVNGLFETGGGLVYMLNLRKLWRDRQISGVHWAPTVFFTLWGIWNLYYYPSLDQWFSFAGGVLLVSVNFLWLALLAWIHISDWAHDDMETVSDESRPV